MIFKLIKEKAKLKIKSCKKTVKINYNKDFLKSLEIKLQKLNDLNRNSIKEYNKILISFCQSKKSLKLLEYSNLRKVSNLHKIENIHHINAQV
jgi:hypothetical protein